MFTVGKHFGSVQISNEQDGFSPISLCKVVLASPMIVKDEYERIYIKKPDGRFLWEAGRNTLFAGAVLEALPRDHPYVVEHFGPEEDNGV